MIVVGIMELAVEQAFDCGEPAVLVIAIMRQRLVIAGHRYRSQIALGRGGDLECDNIRMQNALQTIAEINKVNAVSAAIFNGTQAANIRIAFADRKEQGLLVAAVKKRGLPPGAGQVIVRSLEMNGIERSAAQGEYQPLSIGIFQ